MKIRLMRSAVAVSALVILLSMSATPSFADNVLYTNGPANSTLNAWGISGAWSVADSFTLSSAATIGSFSVDLWLTPGDVPRTTGWAITTAPDFSGIGGTALISGTGTFSNTLLGIKGWNYFDLYSSTVGGLNVSLPAGTYYLELYDAKSSCDCVSWDINNGPSTAYQTNKGNVNGYLFPGTNSSAFTIYATPEPGTILMFGTGVLGLIGAVRRRFSV